MAAPLADLLRAWRAQTGIQLHYAETPTARLSSALAVPLV